MKCLLPIVAGFLLLNDATASSPAKDFTLPSATDASLVRLSDYPGKVVLVNWWRTSCAWSRGESPRLAALNKKYRDKGLVILSVSDDNGSTVKDIPPYLQKYGVTWPVGLNDQGEFKREFIKPGLGDTPQNFVIARNGVVTSLGLDQSGETYWATVEQAVAAALAEPIPGAAAIAPRALEAAPPFSLPDLQGKLVKLSTFAGKPLVVNFFTEQTCDWAGTVLAKLHRDYGGRGLQIVGIDLYDQNPAIQRCVQKHDATYPILKGTQATQQGWIGRNAGWATFFVTPNGKVFKRIDESIEDGMEAAVFPKFAEYLTKR